MKPRLSISLFGLLALIFTHSLYAQSGPTPSEIARYEGLFKAVQMSDTDAALKLIKVGAELEERDGSGRTPVIVATFASNDRMVEMLADAGADLDALEHRLYDVVTIAAVANDVEMLKLVLEKGASAKNITSPYDGTALIAAAHLGHHQVVELLIEYDAPLDHVNNLEWTALIEAVVLGDGGPDHTQTVKLLLDAGADQTIGDSQGMTPIELAQSNGYQQMVKLFLETDK